MKNAMEYIAYLHKDPDSDYCVSFPDFPGCITAGSTIEEARRMAGEALAFHIAGLLEDGEGIPLPSSCDRFRVDAAEEYFSIFRVEVALPQASPEQR